MKKEYKLHTEITKELLDTIKVGDLIKVNDWNKPFRVRGVSQNYFVMSKKQFKDTYYSVCEKKQWSGSQYNAMTGGMFHCGRDNWILGSINFNYDFEDEVGVEKYLNEFECGETEISQRNAIAIYQIIIK